MSEAVGIFIAFFGVLGIVEAGAIYLISALPFPLSASKNMKIGVGSSKSNPQLSFTLLNLSPSSPLLTPPPTPPPTPFLLGILRKVETV